MSKYLMFICFICISICSSCSALKLASNPYVIDGAEVLTAEICAYEDPPTDYLTPITAVVAVASTAGAAVYLSGKKKVPNAPSV